MATDDDSLDLEFLLREEISDIDFEIPAASAVDWRALKDADARIEWNMLRRWVEWFTTRYDIPDAVLPACWYKHAILVEELSALHAAHIVAFDHSDPGSGPIEWHELLSETLPRLRNAYHGGCTDGHRRYFMRSWTNAVDEQEWNGWVNQTHA